MPLHGVLPDKKLSIKVIKLCAVLSVNNHKLPIHTIAPIERICIDTNHVLRHILN